ncbi:coiled-coil and C2 domain-containing protein 1A [Clonorchis sinensis]|uniref:Coiled-coil and C2 domain-containing protein 1A n=1 Tax=Clonorchis sinensis TaxID=79923 RepID=H2KPJ7_CLOSI|nr:coiled-coil and C2 domain-containing protein 1A [Clonorchis sinensis]
MPKKSRDGKMNLVFPLLDTNDPIAINPSELEDELRDLIGTSGAWEECESSGEEPDENDPKLLAELHEFLSGSESVTKLPLPDEPIINKRTQSPHPGVSRDKVSIERPVEVDPKLLAELQEFISADEPVTKLTVTEESTQSANSGVSLDEVATRITGYRATIQQLQSTQPVDGAKIRRYERILKQLESIATRISNGHLVNADELPAPAPPLAPLPSAYQPSATPASMVAAVENQNKQSSNQHAEPLAAPTSSAVPLQALKHRCQEYKVAAIRARDAGRIPEAKKLLGAVKFIESMVPKIESGEEQFDPDSDMPPTPEEFLSMPDDESDDTTPSSAPHAPNTQQPQLPRAVLSSTVTSENLQMRLNYFKNQLEESKSNPSDTSRTRRFMRIITQYEQALRAFDHGLANYAYSDLPPPPNCPVLSNPASLQRTLGDGSNPKSHLGQRSADMSKNERIVALLKKRQVELKSAALKAKEAGNIELAKTHLRAACRIDPMISSAEAGIPFDISSLPPPPKPLTVAPRTQATMFSGPILSGITCEPPDVFRLELKALHSQEERNTCVLQLLEKQAKEASERALQFEQAGLHEIAAKMSELFRIGEISVRSFRSRMLSGSSPSYVFEKANIPQLNMNQDLGDDVLEVTVVRGFTYPLPSDISSVDKLDTQVELQLPAPSVDTPQKHLTSWHKHTADPIYDSVARFQVDTKSRSFNLLLKRKLKATIYYSRGLLRSARVLGTAQFPLDELATSATVTQTVSLMDGRKAVGGGLELRLRQRSCGAGPRMTSVEKPWLVLQFTSTSRPPPPAAHTRVSPTTVGRESPSQHNRSSPQECHPMNKSFDSSRQPTRGGVGLRNVDGRERSKTPVSIEVLKRDQKYFAERLHGPDGMRNKSKLESVTRKLEELEHRFSGADAAYQKKIYVEQLKDLYDLIHAKLTDAVRRGDEVEILKYSERLKLVKQEIYGFRSSTGQQPEKSCHPVYRTNAATVHEVSQNQSASWRDPQLASGRKNRNNIPAIPSPHYPNTSRR